MDFPFKLTPIGNPPYLHRDVGHSYTLGKSCYLVLTTDSFGYYPSVMPTNLPFFFPKQYFTIPLSEIRIVEFRLENIYCFGILILHFSASAEEEDKSIIQFEVGFIDHWVAAFRKTGLKMSIPPNFYTFGAILRRFQWHILYVSAFDHLFC
jgi:hypothetical protein